MEKIKVMLDDGAFVPTRAHSIDAGLDLYAMDGAVIFRDGSHTFDTGVHIEIPEGYVGFLKSKSGLNINNGLQSAGVIDSGYTGSIRVKLYNHGHEMVRIVRGQKISQLVILPVATPEVELVDEFAETERGSNGFGSSGAMYGGTIGTKVKK